MILTYKYRLKGKTSRLSAQARAVNFVWNFCTETQKKAQKIYSQDRSQRWPSHFDLAALAKGTSKELGLHAQSVGSTCEQFAKSRDGHKKCPRFRASSGPKKALGWIPFQRQSRQVDGNSITYLGKTYRFFGAGRRPLPNDVRGGAFVEDALGRWWITFHVGVESLPVGEGEIGIDLGLKTLATTSDGEKIANPRSYRTLENKLAIAQRAGKAVRVKAIHSKIANVRRDHLHKASTKLADANRLIVVGDVNSTKLAKTRMAKSVLDAGWSMFRNMLRYKASRHGATFLEVNENFTTQTCSLCGDCALDGRPKGIAGLGIREWVCSSCGASHDRDVNAAKNILALGLSAQPRVDESRRGCLMATSRIGTAIALFRANRTKQTRNRR
jgi:putative transposase